MGTLLQEDKHTMRQKLLKVKRKCKSHTLSFFMFLFQLVWEKVLVFGIISKGWVKIYKTFSHRLPSVIGTTINLLLFYFWASSIAGKGYHRLVLLTNFCLHYEDRIHFTHMINNLIKLLWIWTEVVILMTVVLSIYILFFYSSIRVLLDLRSFIWFFPIQILTYVFYFFFFYFFFFFR